MNSSPWIELGARPEMRSSSASISNVTLLLPGTTSSFVAPCAADAGASSLASAARGFDGFCSHATKATAAAQIASCGALLENDIRPPNVVRPR